MQAEVRPGDILLGKYRVERVLGKGGMGLVLAVRHLHLDELFAMKLLLPQALSSPQAVERFVREARAAAKLRSEHVAKVHDVGCFESGEPYMVMEHLEGLDLKQVLRARGPLPLEDVLAYMRQTCEAIAEAHERGIIHRDLKPANLFLTRRQTGEPCVKVLDFGISKERTEHGGDLTQTGMIMGSPLYMSPEQMARCKDVDARGDIWALGVILYELSTGSTPFRPGPLMELVAQVLQEAPPNPCTLRPDLPPAFDALVMRCLKKRPEERIQTVAELRAALDLVSNAASHETATPAAITVRGTVKMPPSQVAGVRAEIVARTDGPTSLAPIPVAPKDERRKSRIWLKSFAIAIASLAMLGGAAVVLFVWSRQHSDTMSGTALAAHRIAGVIMWEAPPPVANVVAVDTGTPAVASTPTERKPIASAPAVATKKTSVSVSERAGGVKETGSHGRDDGSIEIPNVPPEETAPIQRRLDFDQGANEGTVPPAP